MTLEDVRAAAIDRALVGDDPEPALALAGVVDSVSRRSTSSRQRADEDDPLAATMLVIGSVAAADRSLDERAWRPGTDADPRAVTGAAVAVRTRGVAIDRAAALVDCAPATLEAVVDRQRRLEKEG